MSKTGPGKTSPFRFDAATGTFHGFGRQFRLPRSRGARITLGCAFVFGGLLGFLPILGFWMVPVGLLILSQDFSTVRRWRRSLSVLIARRWKRASRA